ASSRPRKTSAYPFKPKSKTSANPPVGRCFGATNKSLAAYGMNASEPLVDGPTSECSISTNARKRELNRFALALAVVASANCARAVSCLQSENLLKSFTGVSPDHNAMWPFVSSQVLAVVFNLHFVSIIDSPPDACISVVRDISVDEFSTTFFACVNKNR